MQASPAFSSGCEVDAVQAMPKQKERLDDVTEAGPEDALALRSALGRFATGVTVITTCDDEGNLEGLTANSFGALSLDPPLVLWNLQRTARSLPRFAAADYFTVNVLSEAQERLARHFATTARNKFQGIPFEAGLGDCPVLPGSLAVIGCKQVRRVDAGDHVIFIGEVIGFSQSEGRPLIFNSGQYHELAPFRKCD